MTRLLLTQLRRYWLQLHGVRGLDAPRLLGASIDSRPGIGSNGAGALQIGAQAWIERGVVLHAFGGRIRLGDYIFIGPYSVIYGHGGVEIGDSTLISMHCRIVSSNHTIPALATDIRSQPDVLRPTRIGRDVWLGAGVSVLGGVTIGDGCVVAAGAVVTRDLPAGSISAGVPAQTVRSRPS